MRSTPSGNNELARIEAAIRAQEALRGILPGEQINAHAAAQRYERMCVMGAGLKPKRSVRRIHLRSYDELFRYQDRA
jgi:hypothetical protein